MQTDDFEMEEEAKRARATVRQAVLATLNEMETRATAANDAYLVFEILALKERLGLPLQ